MEENIELMDVMEEIAQQILSISTTDFAIVDVQDCQILDIKDSK